MNDSQITHQINQAKDQVGVITLESARQQLSSFSQADWQEASKLFAQDPAKPDGFSIVDNGSNVTIHNDMSQASKIANTSVSDLTSDDFGTVFNYACGAVSAAAVAAGVGATAYEAAASGLTMEVLTDAGLMAGGSAALFGGLVAMAGVGVVMAGDAARNHLRQGVAQKDVASNSVVNFPAPTSAPA